MLYARTNTLLSVKNVSLRLGGKQILRDINMEIKDVVRPNMTQGQIVALIGQSGAGKSTLFSLMSGIRKPDIGKILVGEKQIPVKLGDMGVVFQNYFIYPWRRVKTILRMAANESHTEETIMETAAKFNLLDHMDKFPRELSGGQQQRVAIAEQILIGSEFLLLDEPFSGLDAITIDKIINVLLKASCIDELKTIVVVSHDLRNAVAISDTVYVLAKQESKDGGTIVKTIDLIERGLAWQPDIRLMPAFEDTIKEIKSLL